MISSTLFNKNSRNQQQQYFNLLQPVLSESSKAWKILSKVALFGSEKNTLLVVFFCGVVGEGKMDSEAEVYKKYLVPLPAMLFICFQKNLLR